MTVCMVTVRTTETTITTSTIYDDDDTFSDRSAWCELITKLKYYNIAPTIWCNNNIYNTFAVASRLPRRLPPIGVGGGGEQEIWVWAGSRLRVPPRPPAPWRRRSRVPSSRHPDTRQDKCRRVRVRISRSTLSPVSQSSGVASAAAGRGGSRRRTCPDRRRSRGGVGRRFLPNG